MRIAELISHLRRRDVRLWIEGDRLRFSAPRGALEDDLRAELARRRSEVLDFLRQAKGISESRTPPIVAGSHEGEAPLSFAQQRLWFLAELDAGNTAYHLPDAERLTGALDVVALRRSLDRIVHRHEILRTTLRKREEGPGQVIASRRRQQLPVVDLARLPPSVCEGEARRLAAAEARRRFDLATGPLLRTTLVRLATEDHVVLVTMHHIVSDAWSMGIFRHELMALYRAFCRGESAASLLPELPVQYADFAIWQRRWLAGEVLAGELDYWREQLAGAPQVLELPTDRPRPPLKTFRGRALPVVLAAPLTGALSDLAREREATLFMVLLAAFQVLLGRYSGQQDVVVGSPIAGRHHQEIEGLIGFFVNTLVLRTDLAGDPSFRQLLSRVRKVTLEAYAHQDLPFEKLVEELRPERNLGHDPLFQVMFALHNVRMPELELPGLELCSLERRSETATFDLTLSLEEAPAAARAAAVTGFVEYNADLFDDTTITRLWKQFTTLLEAVARGPEVRLSRLPLLTAPERHQLLEWHDTAAPYPGEAFHELVAARAAATPDAVAVVFRDRALTYRELDWQAHRLAHHLRSLGVAPEVRVGICVDRSPEMIVALLGILKAGGAYVPLDSTYPPKRLAYMIEDARLAALVTRQPPAGVLPAFAGKIVDLDADREKIAACEDAGPPCGVRPDNLAYVIYTSGSTGRPKGVEVTHRGLTNLAAAQLRSFAEPPQGRVLQFASLNFDASVFEISMALAAGACLILDSAESLLPGLLLCDLLQRQRITNLTVPPSALSVTSADRLPALATLIVAGEACGAELVERWAPEGRTPGRRFWNGYGPTEDTVWATTARCFPGGGGPAIGRPRANARTHVLDRRLAPVPIGVRGELHLGGVGLARGYLGRPEVTAEKFIPNPFAEDPGARLYRTGDLVRTRPDGNLDFLGRIDHQVKIRGFRVELGEVAAVLERHPEVREAVAILGQEERLVAYLAPAEGCDPGFESLRDFLRQRLPGHMVPAALVRLNELPRNPSGKVDRAALPAPDGAALEPEAGDVPPRSELEETIAAIWCQALGREKVGVHQNFFDLGGHSLLVVEVVGRLEEALGQKVEVLEIFEHPTVASLARALRPQTTRPPDRQRWVAARRRWDGEIAITGMAGRFPGAPDLTHFWRNLAQGVESISFFTPTELAAAGVPRSTAERPGFVPARGVLAGAELFDAGFFGLNPREAQLLDPQQRIFLEVAWEALEDAGCDPESFAGEIGIFAGTSLSTYMIHNLMRQPALAEWASAFDVGLGNLDDFLTTRLSYCLDLHGPSISVSTACSTSLVAVHLACQSLQEGECDAALAGAVTVAFPQRVGYLHEPDGILSADGHCRVFDREASGTVFGDGVGVVVLKRLEDALAHGDRLRAVIKGTAVNNDGYEKIGFTAPSVSRQAEVIARAQQIAGLDPETITYVEAHGTGTSLGDPVEIRALTQAFRAGTDKKGFCAIGSVKSNVGHLDSAAGITGLIKAVLALEHRRIPPSLHFEAPNPEIDFAASPFYVNTALRPWDTDGIPRRAGVNSFGIGGTNVHVILEETPAARSGRPQPSGPSRPWQLLVLSARSAPALDAATANLREHLEAHPELDLADVAFTLELGRRAFDHRRAVVCRDREDAVEALGALDRRRVFTGKRQSGDGSVAFLFSGQGAQYPNMARELYEEEATFRRRLDVCCEILDPCLDLDLKTLLFPPADGVEAAEEKLRHTAFAQPALFVVEYATAELWREWGVGPRAMLGHSIGEYVAACLAGVFSLEDALALVAERGRLMQAMPEGAMLAISLPEEEVLARLPEGLELAAVNAPSRCVVSGPRSAVEIFRQELASGGAGCRVLRTSHAFHSAMMEPAVALFREEVAKVRRHPPRIRFLSNVTGTWIRDREATDPGYWARHLRATVRFADGLGELLREPPTALLEVGPGNTLVTLVRAQAPGAAPPAALASLPHPNDRRSHLASMLSAAGRLWLAGVDIDGAGLYGRQRRSKVPLPTYPFERQRYWIEPSDGPGITDALAGGLPRLRKNPRIDDWFYVPTWRESFARPAAAGGERTAEKRTWLVFVDELGLGSEIVSRLRGEDRRVTAVRAGDRYARSTDGTVTIDPQQAADYRRLLAALEVPPDNVLHLWNVAETVPQAAGDGLFAKAQTVGYYSLLFLAQALAAAGLEDPLEIVVASSNLYDVSGQERSCPEKATLLGPCMVIPQEHQDISCRSVDLDLSGGSASGSSIAEMASQILAEAASQPGASVIAYRGDRRWVRSFEQVPLERPEATPQPLRQLRDRGVYLITGGLGNVGLLVAEHLARAVQSRLVLTGRSALPPRDRWEALVASRGKEDEQSRIIKKIMKLEELGAEVMTVSADVADDERMQAVMRRIDGRFGELHGVIHAAGILAGDSIMRPLVEIGYDESELQFRPKVHGLYVLEKVLAGRTLDFCILLSSNAAVLGGLGFVAYSAANLFMDAFAASRRKDPGLPWISSNWDGWPAADETSESAVATSMAEFSMTREESLDAFQRVIGGGRQPQVVVSTGDLEARRDLWVNRSSGERKADGTRFARPELETGYEAPSNETEGTVAEIWQELLGIEQIGVHDNFFDLGGQSLLATRIMSRLREAFEVELSLERLFETPTVAGLAQQIETVRWARKAAAAAASVAPDESEEGEL